MDKNNANKNDKYYDVIIIGGGIQGAGTAQLFALNGYSTLLLEQYEFASQTSSRSSKLIHGGLRYLESLQFGLVKTCLQDREILLKLAPDLVKLVPFYIPLYRHTSRNPLIINIGLWLYSLLGGFRASTRFSRIKRADWKTLDGLEQKDLLAVFQYFDGRTDDRLLTQAVIASARHYGAVCLQRAKYLQASHTDNQCRMTYRHNDSIYKVSSRLIVNASGPWVNQVLDTVTPLQRGLDIDLVQGTHVELDCQLSKGMYYVEAPADKRAVFIMSHNDRVLIGTTEKIYQGDPAAVSPSEQEIQYLINTAAGYFPALEHCRVLNSYAGLRVLPKSKNSKKSMFKRSRDTIIVTDNPDHPQIISVYGGKLTSYRSTAEKIYKAAMKNLSPGDQALISAADSPLTCVGPLKSVNE